MDHPDCFPSYLLFEPKSVQWKYIDAYLEQYCELEGWNEYTDQWLEANHKEVFKMRLLRDQLAAEQGWELHQVDRVKELENKLAHSLPLLPIDDWMLDLPVPAPGYLPPQLAQPTQHRQKRGPPPDFQPMTVMVPDLSVRLQPGMAIPLTEHTMHADTHPQHMRCFSTLIDFRNHVNYFNGRVGRGLWIKFYDMYKKHVAKHIKQDKHNNGASVVKEGQYHKRWEHCMRECTIRGTLPTLVYLSLSFEQRQELATKYCKT